MTAHERFITQGETLVHDFPERVEIAFRRTSDIDKIQSHDALVESSIILWLIVFIAIGRQEGTASHAWITMAFAFRVDFERKHELF